MRKRTKNNNPGEDYPGLHHRCDGRWGGGRAHLRAEFMTDTTPTPAPIPRRHLQAATACDGCCQPIAEGCD